MSDLDPGLFETHKNWNAFGYRDPLWSILSYEGKKGGKWDLEEFFRTGEKEIASVMEYLEGLKRPFSRKKALDFGCGVGRLTQALCGYFDECYGVDIAESMIRQAEELNRFADRCHYRLNLTSDLSYFSDNTFDFIYTNIVLQHNLPENSRKYIQEFLRILAPGGMLVFQLPSEVIASTCEQKTLSSGGFRAAIEVLEAPGEVAPGDVAVLRVRVKNAGTERWPGRNNVNVFPIKLGNHWLDDQGKMLVQDDGRTNLPMDLKSGEDVVLDLSIMAPGKPGRYMLELDMVQELVAWFKDKGSATVFLPVNVVEKTGFVSDHQIKTGQMTATETSGAESESGEAFVPHIEMHGIRREEVLEIIARSGGEILDIQKDDAAEGWYSYRYCATKKEIPHLSREEMQRAKIKVSAIVSTYNAEKLIRGCLEDLVQQTLFQKGQLEIIVVNSGSEENEDAIVHEFQEKYANIVILNTERETIYQAWNRGIKIARGEMITNANTDDAHRSDALELMAAALEAHPEADLAYCHSDWNDHPDGSFYNAQPIVRAIYPPYDPAVAMLYCLLGPHPMWRKTVFSKLGLFDPSFTAVGDYDYLFRFVKAGLKAVLVPEVLSQFYINLEGLSREDNKSEKEALQLYARYRSTMPIEKLYAVDPQNRSECARAWIAQGNLACRFPVPWENYDLTSFDYAVMCFRKAIELEPENKTAAYNLIAVNSRMGKWKECEALSRELFVSFPDPLMNFIQEHIPLELMDVVTPPPAVEPIIYGVPPEQTGCARQEYPVQYGTGFYEDEFGTRWMHRVSEINIPSTVCKKGSLLFFKLACAPLNYYPNRQAAVEIAVNQSAVGRIILGEGAEAHNIVILLKPSEEDIFIQFTSSDTFIPSKVSDSIDERLLSVNFSDVKIQALNLEPPAFENMMQDDSMTMGAWIIPAQLEMGGGIKAHGFYPPEQDGVAWMALVGRLHLPVENLNAPVHLSFELSCEGQKIPDYLPFQVIAAGGKPSFQAVINFSEPGETKLVDIEINNFVEDQNIFLASSGAFVPSRLGLNDDARTLAVQIKNLKMEPSIDGGKAPSSIKIKDRELVIPFGKGVSGAGFYSPEPGGAAWMKKRGELRIDHEEFPCGFSFEVKCSDPSKYNVFPFGVSLWVNDEFLGKLVFNFGDYTKFVRLKFPRDEKDIILRLESEQTLIPSPLEERTLSVNVKNIRLEK